NDGLVAAFKWQGDEKPRYLWAERAKRAHYNSIENLIPFAAIVVVAHLASISNEATASAAIAFFWLRVIHYLFYMFGISYIRTLAFIGSWLAQICIIYQILIN
ncbi:MAG: MAPEG family protein, partial [Pseudomonadota bacterium]|nr:MAPEG family protein [Pseudomonadota bacterium]